MSRILLFIIIARDKTERERGRLFLQFYHRITTEANFQDRSKMDHRLTGRSRLYNIESPGTTSLLVC